VTDSIGAAGEGEAARSTCPFLRVSEGDGGFSCRAVDPPWSPSPLQRGLLCLTPSHEACPFSLRARQIVRPPVRTSVAQALRQPPILAAALVFVAAASLALAVVVGRGGLELPPRHLPEASLPVTGGESPSLPAGLASPTTTAGGGTLPSVATSPSPVLTAPADQGPSVSPPASPSEALLRWLALPSCPGGADCRLYTVQRGDTLTRIARLFDTTVAQLTAANPEVEPNLIHPGETIRIPRPGG
jgi:nucleoid-associated protein YgaU